MCTSCIAVTHRTSPLGTWDYYQTRLANNRPIEASTRSSLPCLSTKRRDPQMHDAASPVESCLASGLDRLPLRRIVEIPFAHYLLASPHLIGNFIHP